jgi:hypothetical protein
MGLADFSFDLALMIMVVGEGVIHLSGRELGKLTQDIFDGES